MNNELYLIHREDYISHIDDKVRLYSMLKQINHMIARLPNNRGNKELSNIAACFDKISEEMFRSWGIPKTYLVFGCEADLSDLMENELIAPEDAGYIEADQYYDDCCCGDCDCCCCDDEDAEDEDVYEFAANMAIFAAAIHDIFGDGVSIHISVE